MVITNSADVIKYSRELIEHFVSKEDMDYDKLRDIIVECLYLERYVTLMELWKDHANLYADTRRYITMDCCKKGFNLNKQFAEAELDVINRILDKEEDAAE